MTNTVCRTDQRFDLTLRDLKPGQMFHYIGSSYNTANTYMVVKLSGSDAPRVSILSLENGYVYDGVPSDRPIVIVHEITIKSDNGKC